MPSSVINGIHGPTSLAASALSGFLMMVVAFGMGGWLGHSLAAQPDSVLPLTNGVWFWSVLIALNAWTLVQRHGDVKTPPVRIVSEPIP